MTTSTMTSRTLLSTLTDLRTALSLDAVVTGLNGVAYVAAGSVLDDVLGIPATVLRVVGVFLIGYALSVWAVRTPRTISRPLAYSVVAANAIWVAGSLVVAISGWHSPTTIGTVWVVTQAAVVAAFAELQITALRRR
ncbi:hypothetical protein MU582_04040 [Nocardioidaceae bacterium SCSIO 66511]|nr:hypothetical protein MU582_04040 [Nocardioidaceae bacterium SCSIO 66511]